MKQVVIIHGGDSFDTYEDFLDDLVNSTIDYERLKPNTGWKEWIANKLSGTDVLTPRFPNAQNANYREWVIFFEKILPFFGKDVTLIGHSLGAMFLAKYLHENTFSAPVKKLVLIAGGYDEAAEGYGSFRITSATGLERSVQEIHLFHSEDDPVVPFSELIKFQVDLPNAISHTFEDRGHFNEPTFPELLEILKQK